MKRILLIVFLLLSRGLSLAWSSPGHMTIAAIAYRDLSDSQKQAVTELLKHHPDYPKWKDNYTMSGSDFDFDTFIFMRASTWETWTMLEPTYKKPNVQPHSFTLISKKSLALLTSDDE
jgi:hypothetical protein